MKQTIAFLIVLAGVSLFSGCIATESKGPAGSLIRTIEKEAVSMNQASEWIKPANPVSPGLERNPNVQIVQNFFGAYGRNDLEGIRAVMADDVEWFIPGRHPLSGTKKGIDQVVAFFGLLQRASFKAEPLIFSANDHYVIDAHRGWSNTGKDDVDLNWILIYQIEDGKIKKVLNFSADAVLSDRFFNSLYTEEDTKLVR